MSLPVWFPAGCVGPTRRWYPLRQHPEYIRLERARTRFRVIPAGRRSGKTEKAKRRIVTAALEAVGPDEAYFAAAPTRDQARAIFWTDLKDLVPRWMINGRPRESQLAIMLNNGASIWVIGMDRPQRIEGRPWNGGVLDEYANMKESAWPENVRPALSDRLGWCWFIGVPEGRNHYYELAQKARTDDTGDWSFHTWKSSEVLPQEEIEAARRDLDPLTFEQEYEASFVSFSGRAYYPFNWSRHCSDGLIYNTRAPLHIAFDFNIDPGVAVLMQEQRLPSGHDGTGIIGEVVIERASNTERVCRRLMDDWGHHVGRVICYGDATGGAGGSAKVTGSDWDIIRRELIKAFHDRLVVDVPAGNPAERSRVNSVNARLLSAADEVRMMVDPKAAPRVVTDFEGVRVIPGTHGEIDKSSPRLTHLTDAIGYYVHRRFPIGVTRPEIVKLTGVY